MLILERVISLTSIGINIVMCNLITFPDSKVHAANMGPTWVLSTPGGPHVGPINLAIKVDIYNGIQDSCPPDSLSHTNRPWPYPRPTDWQRNILSAQGLQKGCLYSEWSCQGLRKEYCELSC